MRFWMSSIAQYLNCAICEELSACRYSISYLKWCYFKNVSFYLILWESEDMMFLQLGREQLLKIFSKNIVIMKMKFKYML